MGKKLFVFLLFICATLFAKASHRIYADITYKSLAGGAYEFTLNDYLDCAGALPIDSIFLRYCSLSKGLSGTFYITLIAKNIAVYPLCSYDSITCVYYKNIYKGTFIPPTAAADWIINSSLGARTGAISTITSPLSEG